MTCWVTLGETLGNAQSLVDMLADSLPEMEELSVGDTWGCAEALSDAWANKVAEFEAVTPGDTLGDAHVLNDLLGDSWRHTAQCGGNGRHVGWHGTRDGGVVSRGNPSRCPGTGRRTGLHASRRGKCGTW